jgi:hypothetical protein
VLSELAIRFMLGDCRLDLLGGNRADQAAVTRSQGGDTDMGPMATRRLRRRCRLAALSDKALYVLLARIETLLLDRPPNGYPLAVEVVHDHEARLLATYRALPEERRLEVLALAERYLATSGKHRDKPERADVYQGQPAKVSSAG